MFRCSQNLKFLLFSVMFEESSAIATWKQKNQSRAIPQIVYSWEVFLKDPLCRCFINGQVTECGVKSVDMLLAAGTFDSMTRTCK